MHPIGKITTNTAIVCTLTSAAYAKPISYLEKLFGCTGRVCVVHANFGGDEEEFLYAAKEIKQKNVLIKIEGPCASGCVSAAGHEPKNFCLGKKAEMSIHRGMHPRIYEQFGKEVFSDKVAAKTYPFEAPAGHRLEIEFSAPDYGSGITKWALRENKLPHEGVYTLTKKEASRYWKRCP